jgi:hypothetical protein
MAGTTLVAAAEITQVATVVSLDWNQDFSIVRENFNYQKKSNGIGIFRPSGCPCTWMRDLLYRAMKLNAEDYLFLDSC